MFSQPTVVDRIVAWARAGVNEWLRTLAFVLVKMQYRSLCGTHRYESGENHRRCPDCGWTVYFNEDETTVRECVYE